MSIERKIGELEHANAHWFRIKEALASSLKATEAALANNDLAVKLHFNRRSLEEYLQEEFHDGKIDFNLRITGINDENVIEGYIYPVGKNGETVNVNIKYNFCVVTQDTKGDL